MSINLLAGYGSDDDEDQDQPIAPTKPTSATKPVIAPSSSTSNKLQLPPPSNSSSANMGSTTSSSSSNTSIAPGNAKKKIQIFVPDVGHQLNNDEDEQRKKKPKVAPNTFGGSGLFSFLPAPKNISVKTETAAAPIPFQPRGMGKKKEESKAIETDFFTLEVERPKPIDEPVRSTTTKPVDLNPDMEIYVPASNQYRMDQYEYGNQPQQEYHYGQELQNPVDPEAMRMLSGRSKHEGPIQLKEVSLAEQIGDKWQYEALKEASKEKKESMNSYMHMAPNSTQKRKHNIMSLAFEAKQRQSELQEMAAHRKASKKASSSKYGMDSECGLI
ncbi:hypothetical protein SmJEL517_g04554 [Synchytrium microbalum]|uniref:Uncharacterized protein n=1 Tax=Synchytrium microbalum TaxID=1806994 RepID=A0A507BRS5_9FUNG|nr:uncharacterized protein SmJEL517_g04554 [Synchytrium microbalum]TPX32370.1 hypothetical protein SmJEL517_g04554 [Synchytrium microbalum]